MLRSQRNRPLLSYPFFETGGLMLWLLLLVLPLGAAASVVAATDELSRAVLALNEGGFDEKAAAADRLAAIDHPRVDLLLQALIDGRLQRRRTDERLVLTTRVESGFDLEDAVTGERLEAVNRRGVRKVAVNNQLRAHLKALKARRGLSAPDANLRLISVEAMFGAVDDEIAPVLEAALETESDAGVRNGIHQALALFALAAGDEASQRTAIQGLSGSVHPSVRGSLAAISEDDSASLSVREEARAALAAIEARLEVYGLVETVFFGLSLGSVLVLAAIGLAITFGVMGVINMAHGELIMLGAYTTFVIQQLMPEAIGMSILVAIPAAFLISGLVGIGIERGVIRFLYGRPLETLLATFGISLILQQSVRTIFSPLNRSVATPEWLSGSLEITAGLSFTYNRLAIIAFSLLVFAGLWMVLHRTRLGLEVRAVAQNRNMARALGVRSAWVDSLTFGLGSGIAGVAGVALSQLTNVGPNLGQSYIVDCFMVVVFGGVGNIWGTLVAGLSLGVANKFLEPVAGAVMAKILVLVFLILFIQRRPRGLFPQKGRAAEA
jgi:urea transport system permease protein